MVVTPVQAFASVTVIVYVIPEHNALAAPVAALIVPLGKIVYTPPAIAVTDAVPSHPGKQLGFVLAMILITGEFGAVNNIVVFPVQPLASVTVIVYVMPEHNALAAPVAALIVPLGKIVYTPPASAVTLAVPSHPGTQLGFVLAVILITGEFGAVNNTVVAPVQPLASVTVIVYVMPEHNALAAPVAALIVPLGKIVYTPPAIEVTSAVPSQPGTQVGFVLDVMAITGEFGAIN